MSVLGLLVSAYLTFEHYTESTTLACSSTGKIDCLKVTTSEYSKVLGIPVADLGVVFFVAMTLLCLPAAWRSGSVLIMRGRLVGCVVGVLSALYLIWAELFGVDAVCLWCTGVHVLTFTLFVIVALAASLAEPDVAP